MADYFVVDARPGDWAPPSTMSATDRKDAADVVTLDVWKHNWVTLSKSVSAVGRNLWGAPEPTWKNEVVYYNTKRVSLLHRLTNIVVHHTNNMDWITAVEESEKNRGFAAIGYHFFIFRKGDIYEGRPLEVMGSHAGEGLTPGVENDPDYGAVGIALQGDYHGWWSDDIWEKQLDVLKGLLNALRDAYAIKKLLLHREVKRGGKPTVCPGEHMAPRIEAIRTELGFDGP
jgi:hypothetical protein